MFNTVPLRPARIYYAVEHPFVSAVVFTFILDITNWVYM